MKRGPWTRSNGYSGDLPGKPWSVGACSRRSARAAPPVCTSDVRLGLPVGSLVDQLDGYVGTGRLRERGRGRLSYFLGLQGPALTVDTACSSSLVACISPAAGTAPRGVRPGPGRRRASDVTPVTFVEFSRGPRQWPPTAAARLFGRADGAGWSEGVGVLVLKRLSDAQRDGDKFWRSSGSAVNQDGRSQGLTAPNGPSQERVIQRALAVAGLRPDGHRRDGGPRDGDQPGRPHRGQRPGWRSSAQSAHEAIRCGWALPSPTSAMPRQPPACWASSRWCSRCNTAVAAHPARRTPSRHIEWEESGLQLLQEAVVADERPGPRAPG